MNPETNGLRHGLNDQPPPIMGAGSNLFSSEQLRLAITAAGVALWAWNVDTDLLTLDARGCGIWGMAHCPAATFEDLSSHIHPADRDRVRAAFAATRAVVGDYEIDFRIMVDEDVRWVSARGRGDDEGIVDRVMFGIFLDVTGRKQAEQANELLAGEMGHRVKNLLAIASGLTMMTSRSAATTVEMARELTQRLSALGRAHDLVQPRSGRHGAAALLGDLLTVLLAPYDDVHAMNDRIRVSVPRMAVGESSAMALALVIHELATNCLKYGALSLPAGSLDVSCTAHDQEVVLVWTERGGPEVLAAPVGLGFGSKLVSRSVSSQLRGSVNYDWAKDGLIITLQMRKARLAG